MKLAEYQEEYEESIINNKEFWKKKAEEMLTWEKRFTSVYKGSFSENEWFKDGELNACYNCIDRWVKSKPDSIALIFDSNEGEATEFTYKQALEEICKIANHLKHLKKGDCVTLYLAMGPVAVFSALACARLGITHNAVFGGFSADSLKLRIEDSKSKLLITQDFVSRGEKTIYFAGNALQAVEGTDIEVLIFDSEASISMHKDLEGMDKVTLWSSLEHSSEYIPCVNVESEHPLFYLYTSGSTGMPKGLVHSTGGYLLYAAYTLKTAFDIQQTDRFCCTADIGWITGHSYSIYGPLCLGCTSVIVEGVPTYPTYYRLFDMVQKYKLTQLYTAPTAIRLLKKFFETNPLDLSSHDFSSLKCLGSVGEPINKEAHKFFSESFGGLHIVDTYWQTETGGFLIAPILGVKQAKPECASLPMPGIFVAIADEDPTEQGVYSLKNEIEVPNSKTNELGRIYITKPWPGMARTILNNPERYKSAYFSTPYYFTGDEGIKDGDGDFWVRGRADDVINVSGHRISTAELESVACSNKYVAEAAVVAISHEIKGQSMVLFVVLKQDFTEYESNIKCTITKHLGGFCRPDRVIKCSGIPKTATGKIMRRVLRSLLSNTEIGDLTTCINIDAIDDLKGLFQADLAKVVK
ncbi:acetyl-coenzyme A synthetase 2 [Glugoides intestinalis]